MRIENPSASRPISSGAKAPPRIAITMNDEASLVRGPSPRMPKAKLVGYMIDMKKKLSNRASTGSQPRARITGGHQGGVHQAVDRQGDVRPGETQQGAARETAQHEEHEPAEGKRVAEPLSVTCQRSSRA